MNDPLSSRAYLVLGVESSGTRLATEILINAGCHGSAEHGQPLDDTNFDLSSIPIHVPVVWRRSFPHGVEHNIPMVAELIQRVGYGREPFAIVTVRDWYCIEQSQVRDRQHSVSISKARTKIEHMYGLIFHKLRMCGLPYRMLVYESLIDNPQAQARFLESIGLRVPEKLIEVRNENMKYYVR